MYFRHFISKYWLNLVITLFTIVLYLFFHFFLSHIIQRDILIIIFIIILLFILFPIKDFLISQQFLSTNWDFLIHSQFHHFEFLARYFTLKDLINEVTPELMIWLKVPEARLFILNPDKKSFNMYYYNKGRLENVHVIPKKRIFYLIKLLKKYNYIINREHEQLPHDEEYILKKFGVHIVVPFYHLNRLMGFVAFYQPTQNPYTNRALELYAIKSALLIHDEILKKRIQNISKYEEELKIAEKIRQMLQCFTPPEIPNFNIQINEIKSATLIEFFSFNNNYFIIILSIPRINGISAMILSGKLGYIFAYLQHHKDNFNVKEFLKFLSLDKELTLENYPVEILIIEIRPVSNYIYTYIENNHQYYFKTQNNKFYRIPNDGKIQLNYNELYLLFYREFYLLSILSTKQE